MQEANSSPFTVNVTNVATFIMNPQGKSNLMLIIKTFTKYDNQIYIYNFTRFGNRRYFNNSICTIYYNLIVKGNAFTVANQHSQALQASAFAQPASRPASTQPYIFMQFSATIMPNNSLTPPTPGWHPLWEILDPPLTTMLMVKTKPNFREI